MSLLCSGLFPSSCILARLPACLPELSPSFGLQHGVVCAGITPTWQPARRPIGFLPQLGALPEAAGGELGLVLQLGPTAAALEAAAPPSR